MRLLARTQQWSVQTLLIRGLTVNFLVQPDSTYLVPGTGSIPAHVTGMTAGGTGFQDFQTVTRFRLEIFRNTINYISNTIIGMVHNLYEFFTF